jgi:hypothetical protein
MSEKNNLTDTANNMAMTPVITELILGFAPFFAFVDNSILHVLQK